MDIAARSGVLQTKSPQARAQGDACHGPLNVRGYFFAGSAGTGSARLRGEAGVAMGVPCGTGATTLGVLLESLDFWFDLSLDDWPDF